MLIEVLLRARHPVVGTEISMLNNRSAVVFTGFTGWAGDWGYEEDYVKD